MLWLSETLRLKGFYDLNEWKKNVWPFITGIVQSDPLRVKKHFAFFEFRSGTFCWTFFASVHHYQKQICAFHRVCGKISAKKIKTFQSNSKFFSLFGLKKNKNFHFRNFKNKKNFSLLTLKTRLAPDRKFAGHSNTVPIPLEPFGTENVMKWKTIAGHSGVAIVKIFRVTSGRRDFVTQ